MYVHTYLFTYMYVRTLAVYKVFITKDNKSYDKNIRYSPSDVSFKEREKESERVYRVSHLKGKKKKK